MTASSLGYDVTDAALDAGSHRTDLTATFTPTDTHTYPDTYVADSVDVEIAQAAIGVVADTPHNITYGQSTPTNLTNTTYADLGPDPDNPIASNFSE